MPSRRRRRRTIAALGAVGAAASLALGGAPGTYAAFSDFGVVKGNTATASIWETNPPAACGDVTKYGEVKYVDAPGGYVHYHLAIPEILGWTKPRIIIVTGGDAVIHASLGDCIVTGPGTTKVIGPALASHVFLGSGTSLCSGVLTPWWFVNCAGFPYYYGPTPLTLAAPLKSPLVLTTTTQDSDSPSASDSNSPKTTDESSDSSAPAAPKAASSSPDDPAKSTSSAPAPTLTPTPTDTPGAGAPIGQTPTAGSSADDTAGGSAASSGAAATDSTEGEQP